MELRWRDWNRGERPDSEGEREGERLAGFVFEGDLESFGLAGSSFSTDGDLVAL